jgi:hypothetical protein
MFLLMPNLCFQLLLRWHPAFSHPAAAQIYTQLTSVMSKVFFPGSDPAVQALSIWGIFAGETNNNSCVATGPINASLYSDCTTQFLSSTFDQQFNWKLQQHAAALIEQVLAADACLAAPRH